MKYSIESEMTKNLIKIASGDVEERLAKAVDLINSASEIFDNCGMYKQSDKLVAMLTKIAKKEKNNKADSLSMFESEFDSMYDDDGIDELLASDIGEGRDKETDIQTDFEDE